MNGSFLAFFCEERSVLALAGSRIGNLVALPRGGFVSLYRRRNRC
jgi:hypothetical protein